MVEFSHSEGNAVIGGYVYRGAAMPLLQEVYLYGTLDSGKIWGLFYDQAGNPAPQVVIPGGLLGGRLISFAEDNAGEIYALTPGRLFRLVPDSSPPPKPFPQTLRATGCVDRTDPTKPAPGLIPYGVNAPLWAGGAAKQRWLALPDGETIHIGPDGDWELPVGTVVIKSFLLHGRLIETRLFVRHNDGGWGGYSYEWNDTQTNAHLLPGGKTKVIDGQPYDYPSRDQCLQCHSKAAGFTLGLETAQINRLNHFQAPLTLPAGNWRFNQLALFDHLGVFDTPLLAPFTTLPALPRFDDDTVPVAVRARAYLHANCSNCHRPRGPGVGRADLRFDTPEAAMNVCNVAPKAGDFGIPDAKLVRPGDPDQSIISLRMHATDFRHMPPIGSQVVDPAGVALIDAWITSLQHCP